MGLSAEQRNQLRDRCKRDLFYLGKVVLKRDLVEQPHREVCDFFVQKNSAIENPLEADETKNRLLMLPRGSFKSSLDVLDAVQWTICYPDIRILILTAEKKLAYAFAEEYRAYFTVVKDHPTDFQLLFPEFCVADGKREPSNEFTTPARKNFKKEPTLWANSIGSNLPGWHCDVLKCDDVVNNVNANEPEQIEKVISYFNYARKLVDPGGYVDVVGTPYDPNDLYAFIQKNAEDLKVLAKPAWTVKTEAKDKPEDERTENDYELLFPSRLTYKFLKKEKKYDPITFESQYLINAHAHAKTLFTDELVRVSVIPWQAIPQSGLSYYAAWDLAYGTKIKTDYTTGFVGAVDNGGRIYLLDMVRGRFHGSELAFRVADFIRRYPLQLTGIEDMLGAQWLQPEIDRAATSLGVQARLHWIPVEKSKDAKIARISRLIPLMEQKKLFLSTALPNLEEVIENFVNFTGSKNAHDDIPDCVSFFPKFVPILPQGQEQNATDWEKIKRDVLKGMLFPEAPAVVVEDYEPPAEPLDYFGFGN